MILEILIIILVTIVVALTINFIEDRKYNKTKMSFKESIDLTGLPIVTFYQENKKFNFLLDTGANLSVINKGALKIVKYNKLENSNNTVTGIDGKPIPADSISLNLTYNNVNYEEKFQVVDMKEAFKTIKKESGVSLIGILGSEFFQKNKYVLDFAKLIAYSKK